MANFSFDVVSEVNLQEVDNAVNQATKEVLTRFDFKGSKSSIEFNKADKKITLVGDDDVKLRALRDILSGRLAKRGVPLKSLNFAAPERPFGSTLHQVIEITMGLPQDKAKELVKLIKSLGIKVQAAIEGDKVRVSGAKKDDLQLVINHLKAANFSLPLQFCNYR